MTKSITQPPWVAMAVRRERCAAAYPSGATRSRAWIFAAVSRTNATWCAAIIRTSPSVFREVGGFDLDTIPRTAPLAAPALPAVIPMVFHCASRKGAFAPPVAALSLYQLFRRRSGHLRFDTREAMLEGFGLGTNTRIVLSGTDHDPSIEGWWKLSDDRRKVIQRLRAMGIAMATTPNYSLFIDQPRWDNLHAMKRIGLVHEEFLSEKLPAALHVNARSETDIHRWTNYVGDRSEVTHVAYEFSTGTGWAGRQEVHADWLAGMARAVGRPLHLIVRGGLSVLPILARSFAQVSVIETSIFMKTIKRQRALMDDTGALVWQPALTPAGAPLDRMLAENYRIVESFLRPIAQPASAGKRAAKG